MMMLGMAPTLTMMTMMMMMTSLTVMMVCDVVGLWSR